MPSRELKAVYHGSNRGTVLCTENRKKKKEAMKSLPEQWQLLFGSQRGS